MTADTRIGQCVDCGSVVMSPLLRCNACVKAKLLSLEPTRAAVDLRIGETTCDSCGIQAMCVEIKLPGIRNGVDQHKYFLCIECVENITERLEEANRGLSNG